MKGDINLVTSATVKRVKGGKTTVLIRQSSACGENCAMCSAKCKEREFETEVINTQNAQPGDSVIIETPSRIVIACAFLVYIVPLAAFIIGYAIISQITNSEVLCVLFAFLLFILTFIILHYYDKKRNQRLKPKIIEIVNRR